MNEGCWSLATGKHTKDLPASGPLHLLVLCLVCCPPGSHLTSPLSLMSSSQGFPDQHRRWQPPYAPSFFFPLSTKYSLSYYIYFTCLCFPLTPPLLECKLCEGGDVFVWDFVCVGICLFCSTLFTVVSLVRGIVLVAQWVLNKDLLSE